MRPQATDHALRDLSIKRCKGCGQLRHAEEFNRHPKAWMQLEPRARCCSRRYTAELTARRRSNNPNYSYRPRPAPDAVAARKREKWQRSDKVRRSSPEGALHNRVRNAVWRSLKGCKRSKTFELLGYSAADLMAHLERLFLPGMGWGNLGEWHIDHIRPVAAFAIREAGDAEFQRCWSLTNLRPLWATDNIRKGAWHEGRRFGMARSGAPYRMRHSGGSIAQAHRTAGE